MIALMKSHYSGERFILSSENLSYKQLFDMISTTLGKKPPFIEATPFLGIIAWRIENLRTLVGGKGLITRENVLVSQKKSFFSNEKFCRAFNAEFQPLAKTIRNIGLYFGKDMNEGWLDRKARKWRKP